MAAFGPMEDGMHGSHYGMLLKELDDGDRADREPGFRAGLPIMLAIALVTLILLVAYGHGMPTIDGM